MVRTRSLAVAVALTSAVVACGDPVGPSGSGPEPSGGGPGTLPSGPAPDQALPWIERCDEIELLTTDVLNEGGAIGNLDPVFHGVLLTYATEHADTFGGLWLDREAFGTVVLAFTDDPDAHREALAARRPSPDDVRAVEPPPEITDDRPIGEWGMPFDVVQVVYTEAQMGDAIGPILDAVQTVLGSPVGGGVDIRRNRVGVDLATPITTDDLSRLTDAIASIDPAGINTAMVCWNGQFTDEAAPPIEPGTSLDVIVLPDADGAYPPDTPVVCGGIGFELGDLDRLTPAADVDPGLRAVLDGWLANDEGQFWPQDGWLLLRDDGEQATFVHLSADGLSSISAEMGANGWIWSGAGGGGECDVQRVLPDGMGAVTWELDPAEPAPDAESTELHVLATEQACASGQAMADRLLGPQVVETDDAVRIAFAVVPLTGGQECPSNPPTPVVIRLDAPLGDRQLRDGMLIAPLTDLFPR